MQEKSENKEQVEVKSYEAPRVERVLEAEEVKRESFYAGVTGYGEETA